MSIGRVIVYGGKGVLGAKCVSLFKSNQYWVASIDYSHNEEADYNIAVRPDDDCMTQESKVNTTLAQQLGDKKLDAIMCVAGGWISGNAKKNLIKISETMWKQSVLTSLISASLASKYLTREGLLVLSGAKAALEPTPGMIGYGCAKSAVHHLVTSLSEHNSGLPKRASIIGVLPTMLDTPMNRQFLNELDYSNCTPPECVAELFLKWARKQGRPRSGTLCQLVTKNNKTKLIPVETTGVPTFADTELAVN